MIRLTFLNKFPYTLGMFEVGQLVATETLLGRVTKVGKASLHFQLLEARGHCAEVYCGGENRYYVTRRKDNTWRIAGYNEEIKVLADRKEW